MPDSRPRGILAQTVETFRRGLREGRWAGALPGTQALAGELGVSVGTAQAALKIIEGEGLLEPVSRGIRRRAAEIAGLPQTTRSLRVGLINEVSFSDEDSYDRLHFQIIQNTLTHHGHTFFHAVEPMRSDSAATLAFMRSARADAWIVASASRPLLEALAAAPPAPVVALGGHFADLPITGTGITLGASIRETVRALADAGHRRIVFFVPRSLQSEGGASFSPFVEALRENGIAPGNYNVPDFDRTPVGFEAALHALFALTPPTAIIVVDSRQTAAIYAYLAGRVPQVRKPCVVTLFHDPSLDWIPGGPTYLRSDMAKLTRFVVDRIDDFAAGKRPVSKAFFIPTLVKGGDFALRP